ncbi:hypothetical protein HMPREF7215_0881 [Pyramidobacter piscolens W5455]|uniref:Uncharacterized protein n=1 Tax=Pyramidobacter piscolens W5455 TaxID=352165 RepID=A0ABM9ZTC6_9BACT|nr:hypothetical protein HMPREF7215_0881 [Pyramidobacter piscolens W5455]
MTSFSTKEPRFIKLDETRLNKKADLAPFFARFKVGFYDHHF